VTRILFWVQHLLGIGHLRRTATLTRSLQNDGFAVTVVSGGLPLPELIDLGAADLVQLPPVQAVDLFFKDLREPDGTPIDDAWRERRRAELLAAYDRIRPDIVLTELFPFGRRQFRFELLPLLEAVRQAMPRPLVACSVRDILVAPPKPERQAEMLATAREFYDLVLVHGDPSVVAFDETFPLMAAITDRVRHTGYVVDRAASGGDSGDANRGDAGRGDAGRGEVIVSAGGGAVSEPLLRAALGARPLTAAAGVPWRLLVGHNLGAGVYDALRATAPPGVTVERARPDFTKLLRNCLLSVSQGGYNTVMEVLDAGARAVIVPYAGGLETEQTLRAERLAARGALHVVPEADLSPERLADAIDRALAAPVGRLAALDATGTETTARLLRGAMRPMPT
jgi:predicted glycosyltransferase